MARVRMISDCRPQFKSTGGKRTLVAKGRRRRGVNVRSRLPAAQEQKLLDPVRDDCGGYRTILGL